MASMSSDLEIALQYVDFILRWFLGWLRDCPQVAVIMLASIWATVLAWKLLSSMKPPPLLASPRTSLLLLLLLLTSLLYCHSLSSQLLLTKADLADSRWSVRQGRVHRLELLDALESRKAVEKEDSPSDGSEKPNPLDGCLHVFLDLGSNRGLQIRKLYEPHLFPLAPILPLYQRYFGPPEERKLQEICSVSVEPNPLHAQHLIDLAASYATCGVRVLVFNHTGVGHRDTTSKFARFNTLLGQEVGQDASARLIHEDETVEGFMESHFHADHPEVDTVHVLRIAKFITDVVAKRHLPNSAKVTVPRVVIKADIEGAELKMIPDMVITGALGHVDNLHMEWHGNASYRQGREAAMISKLAPAITALGELSESEELEHKFTVEEMDDETYSGLLIYKPWGDYSELPVPTC